MKPSERITKILSDAGYITVGSTDPYISSIIQYLDEQHEQCLENSKQQFNKDHRQLS